MSPELQARYDDIMAEVRPSLEAGTSPVIIKAIVVQVYTAEEARGRIDREGSVVRDMGGRVVPHPSIKIEADAVKLYTGLIAKHARKRTPQKGRF